SSAAAATAESICGTMTASVDRVVRVTVNAKTELSYSRVCEILARAGFVPDCECKIDYEKNSRNEIEVLTLAGKQRYEVSIDDDRS
ncbi:MAG: hypothetical protein N2578_10390, partial [Bdellovibrionaceae bacterium]|nr:hypothetical protein [Pseudobdellovibrionaceae bacterium]